MRELIIGVMIFFVTLVGYIISAVVNIPNKQIIGSGEDLTDVYLGGKHRPELTALQRKVALEYKSLKLPKYKIPFGDFCFPKKFKLQNPQKFAAKYMAPGTSHMELLGFHKIGSG
jgi:hypothetical protein